MDLDGRIVMKMKGNAVGLIVVTFIVVEFQMAAHRWSVDMRGLRGARVWLGGTQCLQPSLNK